MKMQYYTKQEMECLLNDNKYYQSLLYKRGFLITSTDINGISDYPFYDNWIKYTDRSIGFTILTHKLLPVYIYKTASKTVFLIGHAYNPFSMEYDENRILADLSKLIYDRVAFWRKVSELTGVFCVGIVSDKGIVFSTDATGMQIVYYSKYRSQYYISSHSKLIADLCGFQKSPYITKLVQSKFYKYKGTWLPGDLSPFEQIKRLQPNFESYYSKKRDTYILKRYFPLNGIEQIDEQYFDKQIGQISTIIEDTMRLIALKWKDKRIAISLTGGKDSKSTLACTYDLQNEFEYFSYISNDPEEIDAKAAAEICKHFHLQHKIYRVPNENELYTDIDNIKKIFECNSGCIGHHNINDIKKRLYFTSLNPFDIEVKSWVNEIGRGWYYLKYRRKHYPKRLSAKECRSLYKFIVDPSLLIATDKVFRDYIRKYYSMLDLSKLSWQDLFYWEFFWGGGEGLFLTSEHKLSYDVTIPFNNRILLEKMLQIPLHLRLNDGIPNAVIESMNPELAKLDIDIMDVSYSKTRILIYVLYYNLFRKIGLP